MFLSDSFYLAEKPLKHLIQTDDIKLSKLGKNARTQFGRYRNISELLGIKMTCRSLAH